MIEYIITDANSLRTTATAPDDVGGWRGYDVAEYQRALREAFAAGVVHPTRANAHRVVARFTTHDAPLVIRGCRYAAKRIHTGIA
jgi:hypothetical protein